MTARGDAVAPGSTSLQPPKFKSCGRHPNLLFADFLGSFADAVEMVFAADVKAAAGDSGSRPDELAEFVARQKLERWLGGKDVNIAGCAGSVDLAVDRERRSGEARVGQPFQPDALAGAGVEAAGQARVVDEVEVLAAGHGAGDV